MIYAHVIQFNSLQRISHQNAHDTRICFKPRLAMFPTEIHQLAVAYLNHMHL